jgi:hypothetical protein
VGGTVQLWHDLKKRIDNLAKGNTTTITRITLAYLKKFPGEKVFNLRLENKLSSGTEKIVAKVSKKFV